MANSKDQQTLSNLTQGSNGPRKSSDVLTERLVQLRERAEQAEQQRDEATNLNRTLSEEVTVLRRQVPDVSHVEAATRNVGLEAELEALRQETAMLHQAVQHKDKALEDLASQCRGLEDVIEDRDREMDRLHRELELLRGDSLDSQDSGSNDMAMEGVETASDSPFVFQDEGFAEVSSADDREDSPAPLASAKTMLTAGIGSLLVITLVFIGVFIFSADQVDFSARELQAVAQIESETVPKAPIETLTSDPTHESGALQPEQPVAVNKPLKMQAQLRSVQDRLGDGSTGPPLVGLPGGEFVMGGTSGWVAKDELPAHKTRLEPFYIGRYEVTFRQYDRFARDTGRSLPDDAGWGRGDRPAINVSWADAKAYTRWLSQQTGKNYRLPSEAEWEYAARGGGRGKFWWGYSPEPGRAVCFDCGSLWDNRSTAPVGSLAANPYGLYDTAGNVMEWIEDCYNKDYTSAPSDGTARLTGDCARRMARGGAYNKPISSLRSTARFQLPRDAGFDMVGFRVARD